MKDNRLMVVFDIDSVLANIEQRTKFIEGEDKDWASFYNPKNVAKDIPVVPIIELYKNFCKTARVEIWTGRQQSTELVTRKWLQVHAGVLPERFRMRPEGLRLGNIELKRQFLKESDRKPDLVFDAQPESSRFWHKRRITVCYTVHKDEDQDE